MWLIEDRVFPRAEELALREALIDLGVGHQVVSNVDLRSNAIAPALGDVPRGSCWWISQLASETNWPSDLWGTITDFSYSYYAQRFGELLLNYPFDKLSYHEFCWRGLDGISSAASLFIRPDDGFKSFEGQVVRSSELDDWVNRTQLLQIRGSSPVIAAPTKEVRAEWRLVLVDGTVVASSLYRPSQSVDVPDTVVAYAENAHRIAGPACRCYVMDIAESADGLRVIEIGSMNCVAFYACGPIEIIRAIAAM